MCKRRHEGATAKIMLKGCDNVYTTVAAERELARFIEEELSDHEFIRIARAFQCGGPRFQLTVDDNTTVMDERVSVGDVWVVIDKACLTLLENMNVDYCNGGFIFDDVDKSYC